MDLRADVLPEVMEPVRAPQAARSRSPRLPPHPHQAAPFSPGARCALDQVDADSSRGGPAQLPRRVAPPRKGCPTEPTGPTRRSMVLTRCTRWTARGRWGVQDRPGGKGGAIGGAGGFTCVEVKDSTREGGMDSPREGGWIQPARRGRIHLAQGGARRLTYI